MDFDRAEPMLPIYFSLRQFWLIKWSFLYIVLRLALHPRIDSRVEPKFYQLCTYMVAPIVCQVLAIGHRSSM